jgi:hypothetical protein
MKKIILVCGMILFTLFSAAQNWNPYVSQGIISPSPLLKVQQNGRGTVSFNIGNTGSSPLEYYADIPGNDVSLIITLVNGLPDVQPLDSSAALKTIGGTWADMFTWQYDMTNNTFTGRQCKVIPGQSQGNIIVGYKVSVDSPENQPKNGFSVKCIPPQYTHSTNTVNDDKVSSFTCTK